MYESLSKYYDIYMEEVPYEKWLENIEYFLNKYNKRGKTLLDLGCGTGTMSVLFSKAGFKVTGIDLSEDMLSEAAQKAEEEGERIFFSCQDMREFEVLGGFDVIVSLCDCMNYITEAENLKEVFKNCRKALKDGGIFIFDINTVYKLKEVLGCGSFCETEEDSAFTCENYFDDETNINEYYVNIFAKAEDGRYERFEELHCERAYTVGEIEGLLKEVGLRLYETADAETLGEPFETSERIYFIAGKED